MKDLVVLGATGSIGSQTLEVAARLGLRIMAVAARAPSPRLVQVAAAWPDAVVAVAGSSGDGPAAALAELPNEVMVGSDAAAHVASFSDVTVVNGIVGASGLEPSVSALEAGNRLALANKESLVAGGSLVTAARDRGGGELIPVDSEHSAMFQVLVGERIERVRRLVLTASGGPLRGMPADRLADVTPAEALAHPTWTMGPRITVDSATLMNKAFEVIEAHHLFGIDYEAIGVIVHPQSVIHSLVEFVDGAVIAELGFPDMRIPIQYALTYPDRLPAPVEAFSLAGTDLHFEQPDGATFPALALGYEAGRRGGSAPAALNAADEVAVAAFLGGAIGFRSIAEVASRTLDAVPWRPVGSVADVLAADKEARATAAGIVEGLSAS